MATGAPRERGCPPWVVLGVKARRGARRPRRVMPGWQYAGEGRRPVCMAAIAIGSPISDFEVVGVLSGAAIRRTEFIERPAAVEAMKERLNPCSRRSS